MTPQEYLLKWDGMLLIRMNPEDLVGVDIPTDAKEFLINAGLPEKEFGIFNFNRLKHKLEILEDVWSNDDETPAEKIYLIGECLYDTYVGLNASGAILYCDPHWELYPDILNRVQYPKKINNSIPQFAESLIVCRKFLSTLRNCQSDSEIDILAAKTESLLVAIDDTSTEESSYWRGFVLNCTV